MYSDRVVAETGTRRTVKNRLNGGSADFSSRGRRITTNRNPDDDKWEHDLFEDDEPQISNRKFDPRDLRLKLQRKHQGLQIGRGTSVGLQDLRQKLSRTKNPQLKISNPPKFKKEAARPVVKKVAGETKSEPRTAPNRTTKRNPQQQVDELVDESVDTFLETLGLGKYSTAFQVEEVDMDALIHMTDDDLKAMLIPMGPRKKILLALGSKHE